MPIRLTIKKHNSQQLQSCSLHRGPINAESGPIIEYPPERLVPVNGNCRRICMHSKMLCKAFLYDQNALKYRLWLDHCEASSIPKATSCFWGGQTLLSRRRERKKEEGCVTAPVLHPISITVLPTGLKTDQYMKLICTENITALLHSHNSE